MPVPRRYYVLALAGVLAIAAVSTWSASASPSASTPICAPSGLRLDRVGGQAFASHREIVFGLRNVTGHTCHLKGYPGVAALNSHARVLTPTAVRTPGSRPT